MSVTARRRDIVALVCIGLACASAGVLAAHQLVAGLSIIGLITLYGLYRTRPHYLAWLALFGTFAALPRAIPAGKNIGDTTIYIHEILLVTAILFLIPKYRSREPIADRNRAAGFGVAITFGVSIAFSAVVGISNGIAFRWVIFDARNVLTMVAAYVLTILLIACNLVPQTVRVVMGVLWFSAGTTLISSTTGMDLRGRGSGQLLNAATGTLVNDTARIISSSQQLALAVLLALLVTAMTSHVRAKTWLYFGLPSAIIVLLGFSRNSILALLVAGVATIVLNFNRAGLSATIRALFASAFVLPIVAASFAIANLMGVGGWIATQASAYSTRVLGGLLLGTEGDESWQFRVGENRALWRAFDTSPILGHGFGYAYQAPIGPPDSFTATAGPYFAHNFYLWLLVKSGIIGILCFVPFALMPISRALRTASIESRVSAVVACSLLVVSYVWPLPEVTYDAAALGMALGAAMGFSQLRQAQPSGQEVTTGPEKVTNGPVRAPRPPGRAMANRSDLLAGRS